MRPTINYVKQKFDEYNKLCFEGKLKPLPFKLSRARRFLGAVTYRRKRNPDGTSHYFDFVFKISTLIDMPESEVEDTILHEMIHYYILSNQMQDTSPHGVIFTKMMNDINARFNRNINVKYKSTEEDFDRDTEIREHYICVMRLRDNRNVILISAKTRLFQLWDQVSRAPDVAEWKWYGSLDPFFNRFPRALTIKFYPITDEELKEHFKDALPLVRVGNKIMVK